MRSIIGYISAALLGSISIAGNPLPNIDVWPAPRENARHVPAKRRNKTGERYPHSSKRQQARYSRQIEAGQLNMAGCRQGGAA